MEPKIASISKKLWNMVRVAIFMIKKGLSKRKMFMDLNMMMKRGKIASASKSLRNLMFHHHHNNHNFSASQDDVGGPNDVPREYEFSCSNTPSYRHYFTNKRKNHHNNNNGVTKCFMPAPYPLDSVDSVDLEEVNNVLEMMLRNGEVTNDSGSASSPALPGLGFGQSPSVRQLRITDSPFPVQNSDENKHVDQDAENFINNFYSQLKQQNY